MRRSRLCAFLSVVSIAALHALPAAAERPMSQERWMLRQDSGARISPRSEVRVHFFNPNQLVRVSQQPSGSSTPPGLRPIVLRSRPVPARPLVVAVSRTAPRLAASHPAGATGGIPLQPEVRSGR